MLNISSDGVALIEWDEEARAVHGQSALDIGAALYESEDGVYSYRNCWIAEVGEQPVGMLLSFPMQARDPAVTVSPPPFDGSDVFAPYRYLEAPDTWYICGVAVLQNHRGQGIGKALMQIAREQALRQGYDQLSLVVFEENTPAVQLYKSLGYKTIDRAPIVPHPLIRCSGDALLMVASTF
jgi:ribosomal protein S18 acetylase RimI-like enzyme